jgi:RHH-type proline utilization regulon transcriptional repressor/proline dehydrogenase/delta 1-pyrroline-5-carboxylate dehydrogenase
MPPVRGLADTGGPSAGGGDGALAALRAWALAQGLGLLAAQCDQAKAESPVGSWQSLPGPTGEANLYAVLPREAVLCLAQDEDDPSRDADHLAQLAAVLAVGSSAVWPVQAQALRERLPAEVRECISLAQDWLQPAVHFDAVLQHGGAKALLATAATLSQRPGPIVGLIGLRPGVGRVPLERLVIERSLSINTAAAGGNASLMTIG